MLVAIAHNAVAANAREDERDVLVQAEAVGTALRELGHTYQLVPIGLDLNAALRQLRELRPELIFNLVESFAGSDRLASLAVAVIEQLGLPVTGSQADVLWVSNVKTLAKQRMLAAGLPTPAACEVVHGKAVFSGEQAFAPAAYILKPISEHASLGMDHSAVVQARSLDELADKVQQRSEQLGRPCFAEQYIDGREFNVSLLASDDGCEVMPLAETDFSDFAPGTPRIVDYSAKWDESSFAYHHTPRKFLIPESEPQLSKELARLARHCWDAFGLDGYVRVDFRVDQAGRAWILEINTNPCLSPDAGFSATLKQAGITFPRAIERILAAAKAPPPVAIVPAVSSETKAMQESGGDVDWRYEVSSDDPHQIRELVAATGFFYPAEVAVAGELVTERLARGDASEYFFVIAEGKGQVRGYACYGPIACTRDSYDLYWIAVHPHAQRTGLGKRILSEAEKQIDRRGGRRVYIETSNRPQYESTRAFYLRCGYVCEATLKDFYGAGDDKVIYVKAL